MINIPKFFIKNNIFLIALSFLLLIGGGLSFFTLNRNEDPGFKIRTASIITEAPNLSAKKVDMYITRPIENALFSMEEIEDIKEESLSGKSVVYADLFEFYNNIQPIWDKLRRKIELAKAGMPDGYNPIVNDEFADVYGALIGISKEGGTYEELYDRARKIRDDFLKLKNRGKVEIVGAQNETLYIRFKNAYLDNLALDLNTIKNLINSSNVIKGGGNITSEFSTTEINPKENFEDLEQIKKTTINIKGHPIFLGEIFDIEKTTQKPTSQLIRANGKNALIVAISLKKDGNILKWGDEIKNEVKKLKEKYKDTNIEILALQSDYVRELTGKFTESLAESIVSVILIVLLILGINSGLIIGGIIVITVLSSFFAMKLLNIGLDKITLSALIISLGILVDNSIVVAQGCLSQRFDNLKEGIISVAYKFQLPLLIVTLTTSLAFLPVMIAKSAVGEYASGLFKVVFISLVFSWFYSVSLLPYLMLKFGHKDNNQNKSAFKLSEFIKKKIPLALNREKEVPLIAILCFLFSLLLFTFVPKIFFPDSDRSMFEIRLNFKNGISFEQNKKACLELERFLLKRKNLGIFSSYIGTSAPRYVLSATPEAGKLNFSMFLINVKKAKFTEEEMKAAKDFVNKNLPSAQTVVRKIPLGPPYDAPVEIRIINNDKETLFKQAETVQNALSKIDGVYLVKNNWGDFILETVVDVNENAALMAGLQPDYIFDYLNTLYNGKTLTYYYRDDIKIPVVLKGDENFFNNLNSINYVSMYSSIKNRIIPLGQVARVENSFTNSRIFRRNNSYVLTVQGWINPSTTADKVTKEIAPYLNSIPNFEYEFGGIKEKSAKGNRSVTEGIPIAFGIIFLILIGYFNNVKKPALIMFCAVLALMGANFGLFITRSDFGFITFLGYICLVGICTNNGVILVNEIQNFTKEEIERAAISRVEPVMLTCLTTIGGMLPLWIKNDPMFSTLGVSIIFGLISSIIITLFVLPAILLLTKNKA